MKKVTSTTSNIPVKDEWLTAAITNNHMVAELLTRLKHADTVVSESSPVNLPPLRWGGRQRRSQSSRFSGGGGVLVSSKKQIDSVRASPKTPLSWSDGSGSRGGSVSPSAATADGFDDNSRKASCSTSTGSRSKAFHTNEITGSFSKRSKKMKFSSDELKFKEKLKLKEMLHLDNKLSSLRSTLNEIDAENQMFKRIKNDLKSARVKKENKVDLIQRESTKPYREVESKTNSKEENQKSFFFLPDLNMVPSDDDIFVCN